MGAPMSCSWTTTARNRWRRFVQVAVGALFVVAAVGKLADFDGFLEKAAYYRAVPYVWMVRTARATIVVEIALGLALCVDRPHRWPGRIAVLMLVGFSLLIAHAWRAYGITDCGCMGAIVETPPWLGIAKNAAMVLLLWWAGRGSSRRQRSGG